MPRVSGAIFGVDPQKKPAFEPRTVVYLTKDYTKLYDSEGCSKYLTKDVFCIREACAYFSCAFDEKTQDYTKNKNDTEWCLVIVVTPVADFLEEEDFVKAVYLKLESDYSIYNKITFYNKITLSRIVIISKLFYKYKKVYFNKVYFG